VSTVERADVRAARTALGAAALALVATTIAARIFGEDLDAFLFVVCAALAAIGVFRPLVAVLAAVVASATYGWVVIGPRLSVFPLLVAAATLGALLQYRAELLSLARRLVRVPELIAATVFVAWICLAALVRRPTGDLAYIRSFVGALVFLVVVAVLARSRVDRGLVAGALVVGAFATGLVGLVQIVSAEAVVSSWVLPGLAFLPDTYSRLASPWGLGAIGSNYAKDVISGFMLLIPLLPLATRRSTRLLLWIPALTLAIALVMSGSRSAWMGAGAALLYLVYAVRDRRVAIGGLAMVALLVLCCVRPTTPAKIQTAIGLSSDRTATAESDDGGGGGTPPPVVAVAGVRSDESTSLSFELRQRLAKAGWLMVKEDPLFGKGPYEFRENVARYVDTTPIDADPRIPSHNLFVEVASDSGLPALLSLIAFLATVAVGLERFRRRARDAFDRALATGLLATLIALVVNAQFHNTIEDNALWTVCGLAVALQLWAGQRSVATPPPRVPAARAEAPAAL
jgi:hypothetical protein